MFKIQVKVFWIVMTCLLPLSSADGCSKVLWNTDTIPQHYMVSQPERWRQPGPSKQWYPTTTLYGITTQKTTWIFTTMKTSNLATFKRIVLIYEDVHNETSSVLYFAALIASKAC